MVLCDIQQKDLKRKGSCPACSAGPNPCPFSCSSCSLPSSTGPVPELRSAKYVFEPPWLLFALNTVFITGLCLLVAWLCFRSFLRGGFLNVLLLGCGVLAFGLSSFAAGWLIRPPHSLNVTLTIHNIGVLFAAFFSS